MLWYFDLRKSNFEITSNLEFVKLINNFDAKYEVNNYKINKIIIKLMQIIF